MKRGRLGFTLVEVLIAMGILSLLTLVLLRLGSFAYRVGREEIERSGAEASLLLTSRRLEEDLMDASPAGVSLVPDGSVLVVHPIDKVTGANRVIYQDRFLHWSWDSVSKKLARCELLAPASGMTFDGLPKRWSPAQIETLPLGDGDRVLLSLERVESFAVLNPSGPNGVSVPQVGGPLTLKISLQLPIAATRKILAIERLFYLRTGGSTYISVTDP